MSKTIDCKYRIIPLEDTNTSYFIGLLVIVDMTAYNCEVPDEIYKLEPPCRRVTPTYQKQTPTSAKLYWIFNESCTQPGTKIVVTGTFIKATLSEIFLRYDLMPEFTGYNITVIINAFIPSSVKYYTTSDGVMLNLCKEGAPMDDTVYCFQQLTNTRPAQVRGDVNIWTNTPKDIEPVIDVTGDIYRVIAEVRTIFGDKYPTYDFVIAYNNHTVGGAAYRNIVEIVICDKISPKVGHDGFLRTLAHECMHFYITLCNADLPRCLWIVEGFTDYMSSIILMLAYPQYNRTLTDMISAAYLYMSRSKTERNKLAPRYPYYKGISVASIVEICLYDRAVESGTLDTAPNLITLTRNWLREHPGFEPALYIEYLSGIVGYPVGEIILPTAPHVLLQYCTGEYGPYPRIYTTNEKADEFTKFATRRPY